MPVHGLEYAVRIIRQILAAIAVAVPLMSPTSADAVEKIAHPASKHQRVVKKGPHGIVKTAKWKKSHPKRVGREKVKKTAVKSASASLTLARDIEVTSTTLRQSPAARPAKVIKPSLDETVPPLQIGKTLYQRNGEIHIREGDNVAATSVAEEFRAESSSAR